MCKHKLQRVTIIYLAAYISPSLALGLFMNAIHVSSFDLSWLCVD